MTRIAHNNYLTPEVIATEALRHTTIGAFRKAHGSAYMAATRLGIKNQVCAHMVTPPRVKKWSDEALQAAANKYLYIKDFRAGDFAAYCTAHSRGILARICAHMLKVPPKIKWTTESLHAVAIKYMRVVDFQKGDWSAYVTAHQRGLLGKICSHMDDSPSRGFDTTKPGRLYYLRIDTRHDTVYKIGITNRTVNERFPTTADRDRITVIGEWEYANGIDARREEKRLHIAHKAHRYVGDNILRGSGNTELFKFDVLGLDVASDGARALRAWAVSHGAYPPSA